MSDFQNRLDSSANNSSRIREERSVHHHPGLGWISPLSEVNEIIARPQEAVLIARMDQYRLGDMLMAHVMSRQLLLSKIRCAGLFGIDQTEYGGHALRNYGECLLEMRSRNLKLIHLGGDLLGSDLIEGYATAAPDEESERFDNLLAISSREQLLRYVRRRTGQLSDFAYLLEPAGDFSGAGLSFHSVGIGDAASLSESRLSNLLRILRQADFLGVRDLDSAEFLENQGLSVERMPCALSVLPQVCVKQLREVRNSPSLNALRHRFPDGWIAVDTSAVSDHDRHRLITALREIVEETNLGLVFIEAEPTSLDSRSKNLRRWVESFPEWQAAEFPSQNVWETASMLLHARLYCGSSLDARSIAMSAGVPRINVPTGTRAVTSYCALWEASDIPVELPTIGSWKESLQQALSVDFALLQRHGAALQARYRESFDHFCESAGVTPRLISETPSLAHEGMIRRLRRAETERRSKQSLSDRRKNGTLHAD